MKNAAKRAPDQVRSADAAVCSADPAVPPRDAASITILVVEDDPLLRQIFVAALSHCGFHVLEAADAESAALLAAAKKTGIDLLLTDVRMPGMSGTELADALLLRPDMKTLFISGYPNDSKGRPFERTVPFLLKPFTSAELVDAVNRVLQR